MAIVAIDIGGTSINLALLADGEIVLRENLPTLSLYGVDDVIVRMVDCLRDIKQRGAAMGFDSQAVGIACAGILDPGHQNIIYSPNLKWRNVPLVSILAQQLNLPIFMGNDADLYALGEYAFGAGEACHDLVCFTLGTGVGGGIVMNGRIPSGQSGWSAELGHTIVEPEGRLCGCGTHGCLEAYASATGLQGMLNDALGQGANTSLKSGDGVKAMDKAAHRGDELAINIFNEAGRYLGLGIVNTVLTTGISLIVLGGGVAKGWSLMSRACWQQIEKSLTIIDWRMIKIELSRLGESAPLKGAAALAQWHLNNINS